MVGGQDIRSMAPWRRRGSARQPLCGGGLERRHEPELPPVEPVDRGLPELRRDLDRAGKRQLGGEASLAVESPAAAAVAGHPGCVKSCEAALEPHQRVIVVLSAPQAPPRVVGGDHRELPEEPMTAEGFEGLPSRGLVHRRNEPRLGAAEVQQRAPVVGPRRIGGGADGAALAKVDGTPEVYGGPPGGPSTRRRAPLRRASTACRGRSGPWPRSACLRSRRSRRQGTSPDRWCLHGR
jgi:hypothetical protein